MNKPADVCLLLEGTYPFVTGGVSHWTHDLIQMHSDLTFSLVSILPTLGEFNPRYTLPPNVVSHQVIRLQILPYNTPKLPHKEAMQFFQQLEGKLLRIQQGGSYTDFEALLKLMDPLKKYLGEESLMRSQEAWKMIVRMYHATLGQACFLDYFWSWRGLMGAFFSILLAPIPEARVYHALCTGYAGLLLARARIELKRPCLITEHGIYTNERKIEIASAEWLHDQGDVDLGLDRSRFERTLKDLWIDIFSTYSRLAYSASEKIITLYKGNQPLQISDGADPKKLLIIPNGIDVDRFKKIIRKPERPLTIALIGRVVPIKDVKTFLHAVSDTKRTIPGLRAWIVGPVDEDPLYYNECCSLMKSLNLEETVSFKGKMNMEDVLSEVDVVALTSISEAQPLTLLEAGAAKIPVVATNVGACSDIILGEEGETPPIGPGGVVTPLADPASIAQALIQLLLNPHFYRECAENLQTRVLRYYRKDQQKMAYEALYQKYVGE